MTGFTVDPDTFGPVAEQIRQAGTQLPTAWEPVRAQSEAVQFGRGDDMISPLIQVSIQGAVSLVDRCIQTSATALSGYADGLDRMGDTYRDVETGTTHMMKPA